MRALQTIIITIILISSCATSKGTQGNCTIYLVRHAEKVKDGTRDPELTSGGHERAARLAALIGSEIGEIYSSDFKRTRDTAQPTSVHVGTEIVIYDHKDLGPLAMKLKKSRPNVLVVGHSNSTPSLANLIIGTEIYRQVDESDYSNILVIQLRDGEVASHEVRKF